MTSVLPYGSESIWKKGRKGLPSSGGAAAAKEVEEDLLAEVQRLRAELEYLKTCKPWFCKTSDAGAKNAGSSEAEVKTFPGDPSLNGSTAPRDLLLSSETNE